MQSPHGHRHHNINCHVMTVLIPYSNLLWHSDMICVRRAFKRHYVSLLRGASFIVSVYIIVLLASIPRWRVRFLSKVWCSVCGDGASFEACHMPASLTNCSGNARGRDVATSLSRASYCCILIVHVFSISFSCSSFTT